MRAAFIFGLGTSPADLKPFNASSPTEWLQGLPASSSDADAILIFGGDGTIHRHLPALVRLQRPVLIVPSGSGNDFARALKLRSVRDSLRVWREFESGKIRARAIDLGVIVPSASPGREHYFCGVAGCGLDATATRRANQMPRWLRGHFRPFAHRLAHEHALSGWVHNDERGVLLEVEGAPDAVERFLERLAQEAPPLSVV